MQNQKQKIIDALIEKPSEYEISVVDNSMLPDNLKNRKTLTFVIKPPSVEVLALCTDISYRIPESIRNNDNLKLEDAIKYKNEMAKIISILSYRKKEYPKWYVPFLIKNLEPKELYVIFYESILKLQSDFFLKSFQIANQNPIMM